MSQIEGVKNTIKKIKETENSEFMKVNNLIRSIHTDIMGEQIKYRKFENYNKR